MSTLSPLRRSAGTEIHQTSVRVTTCARACPRSLPLLATNDRSSGPSMLTEMNRTPLCLRISLAVGAVFTGTGEPGFGLDGATALAEGDAAGASSRCLRFHPQTPDATAPAKSIKRT